MEIKAADISCLKFPDNVRMRHGMYINNTNHMVDEIIENSIDEYTAGHATCLFVGITKDFVVTVEDDGAGIPVTKVDPKKDPDHEGMTQVEVAMTVLHAGGKFGEEGGYTAKTGGINGKQVA